MRLAFLAFFLPCFLLFSANIYCSCYEARKEYKLTKTWDQQTPSDTPEIALSITAKTAGLVLTVDAPFYDDPKLPREVEEVPGRVPGLWDYEVVEFFFLGTNETYLEIELGPRGHYLLYFLHGVRNVTKSDIPLQNYSTHLVKTPKGMRWNGEAIIPYDILPSDVSKFNAYAIHKSNEERTYMALFPVPPEKFKEPDFHRLKYFQPIDFQLS